MNYNVIELGKLAKKSIDGSKNCEANNMKKELKNHLPIFGLDVIDDWSFDKLEEQMREEHDDDSSDSDDQE